MIYKRIIHNKVHSLTTQKISQNVQPDSGLKTYGKHNIVMCTNYSRSTLCSIIVMSNNNKENI